MIAAIDDSVVIGAIAAGGDRLKALMSWAVATRCRAAIEADDAGCEEAIGPVEDWLLHTVSAMRVLRAARGGHGDPHEAAVEAGKAIVGLIEALHEFRQDALAAIGKT